MKSLGLKLGFFVIFMLGFGFFMIPVFHWICNITGMHAKPSANLNHTVINVDRDFRMELMFHKNTKLPLEIRISNDHLVLHPGEKKKVVASAKNIGGDPVHVRLATATAPEPMAGKIGSSLHSQYLTIEAGETKTWEFYVSVASEFPEQIKSGVVSLFLFDTEASWRKK